MSIKMKPRAEVIHSRGREPAGGVVDGRVLFVGGGKTGNGKRDTSNQWAEVYLLRRLWVSLPLRDYFFGRRKFMLVFEALFVVGSLMLALPMATI